MPSKSRLFDIFGFSVFLASFSLILVLLLSGEQTPTYCLVPFVASGILIAYRIESKQSDDEIDESRIKRNEANEIDKS